MRFLVAFKAVVFAYRVKNSGSWVKITLNAGCRWIYVDKPLAANRFTTVSSLAMFKATVESKLAATN
ncbi:hypothetical protein BCV39_16660 [Vibrio sp. 10N.286.55.E10]|uniref:hypothetical protein n=1 Tax=Vibrio sp. 10N.286.45.A3 TaxID=2056188 RepID=UPI000C838DF8|nr:hypothetical protein [Vibrio sp. 10N.286.45.A3]PME30186.1 hypothetical protein BCV40_02775 [Vibrio sp. 10N.286.55.E12]PME36082.1 hypothetical protein BCV39_16660 [Vibrio sp. 10N.286.55.E10]PME65313.1 hypothetical protein BCV32_19725 [Vibrio sp. 10N.286.55.C11]PMI25017.1 hypothetical protein BCU50_04145 [Vibrio sp. 10N.286.46.E10]PTO98235.1 hypothetical protein CWO08_00860 [Vibrio sp. 10N.286.48.B8]PTP17119.1 hypothetical protein CWO27_00910 [Vibrio sp. 10N.286.51.C3]PTQ05976.1 hypothetica